MAKQTRSFSRKARFYGPHSRLEVFAKPKNGSFIVFVLHRKGGVDSKTRGMVSEHKTEVDAVKRFDEVVKESRKSGWQEKVTGMKSSFDSVPAAD